MKNIVNLTVSILLIAQPVQAHAFSFKWADLWQTADQQGAALLKQGNAEKAAATFKNKNWQAVAAYRAGQFDQAYQHFSAVNTSDSQYNAGNAAANQEHYEEALRAYDKAIALNPNNQDAIANREIVKKIMNQPKPPENKSSGKDEKKNQNKSGNNQDSDTNTSNKADEKQSSENNDSKKSNDSKNDQSKEDNNKSNQPEGARKEPVKNENISPENTKEGKPDPQNNSASEVERVKANDEDKRQLLRRIADDPGGLLRQKFLRDYYRRHGVIDNTDQGDF